MGNVRLVDANKELVNSATEEDISSRLASGTYFWLDIAHVGDDPEDQRHLDWLTSLLKLHPLTVHNLTQFGQRPKLDEFDEYMSLVLYGSASAESAKPPAPAAGSLNGPSSDASPQSAADQPFDASRLEEMTEIHCILAEGYMLTLHRGDCQAFERHLADAHTWEMGPQGKAVLFYRMANSLADSFFPVLSDLDDRLDDIQRDVMRKPDNQQLAELMDCRAALITLRRAIAPQRDAFATMASEVVQVPGFGEDSNRYLRDIYDHLIRLSDLVDSYRDLISGSTDAYLSVVSNQLNVVMKQLAVIATVFLPLSFLTGFFGQNFSYLVNSLNGWPIFVVAGLGTEVVAVVAMFVLFKKRGWLGSD